MKLEHSTRPELMLPIIHKGILPGIVTGEINGCNPLRGPSPYIYFTARKETKKPDWYGWGECHFYLDEDFVRQNSVNLREYSTQPRNDDFENYIKSLNISRLPSEDCTFKRHLEAGNQVISVAPIPPEALDILVCRFDEIIDIAKTINPKLKVINK